MVAIIRGVSPSMFPIQERPLEERPMDASLKDVEGRSSLQKSLAIPSPQTESPAPGVNSTRDKLKDEIGFFKGLGYKVLPSMGITAFGEGDDFLTRNNISPGKVTKYESKSPLEQLEYQFGPDKEIAVPLSQSRGQITVVPIELKVRRLSPTIAEVKIYDYLSGGNPLVYNREVSVDDFFQTTPLESQEVTGAISQLIDERASIHENYIRKIDPKPLPPNERVTILPASNLKVDGVSWDNLNRLCNETFPSGIRVQTTPEGGEIDRRFTVDKCAKTFYFELDTKRLNSLEQSPVQVLGDIQSIDFDLPFEVESVDETNKTVNGKPVSRMFRDKRGSLCVEDHYQDKYGNFFYETMDLPHSDKSRVLKSVSIHPATPFINSGEEAQARVPLNLDLSSLGYGEIQGAFLSTPPAFLESTCDYDFYSNMEPHTTTQDFAHAFPGLADGASSLENLFGFSRGEKVKNIMIVNSNGENAFFHPRNPSTIVIQDEYLKGKNPEGAVGFHESAHLLDGSTGNTLSSGSFGELWEELIKNPHGRDFFATINEQKFLPNGFGGHSQDNSKEFLATFLNTFNHPHWEEAVSNPSSEFPRTFRKNYLKALVALEETIKGVPEIPSNAPIFRELETKKAFLDAIIQKTPTSRPESEL